MPCGETIIVMYHYVRPVDRQNWGGIFPLGPSEFERQLDYLSSVGRIIRPSELGRVPPEERHQIVLTFDDGTRDHYETVFPILRARGLSGLFGVISGPSTGQRMPNVHLIHWLLSRHTDADIWAYLCKAFGEPCLGDPGRAVQLYHRDEPLRGRIKFALNFALTTEQAGEFLEALAAARGEAPSSLARQWYVSSTEIREMLAGGMELAVHADRHLAFSGDPAAFYDCEIKPCEQWLTELAGRRPEYYIAAFGGSNAGGHPVNGLAGLLAARGYRYGFLTERGIESQPPGRFFLRRIDCADLPPRGLAGVSAGLGVVGYS